MFLTHVFVFYISAMSTDCLVFILKLQTVILVLRPDISCVRGQTLRTLFVTSIENSCKSLIDFAEMTSSTNSPPQSSWVSGWMCYGSICSVGHQSVSHPVTPDITSHKQSPVTMTVFTERMCNLQIHNQNVSFGNVVTPLSEYLNLDST